MKWLWPIKSGKTVFDVWFVVHFAFWIVAGSTFAAFHVPLMYGMLMMVGLAFAWELFERYAEVNLPNIWKNTESWVNAYLSDIGIAGVLGTLFGYWLYWNQ
jgi:hypothetical protein